MKVSLLKILRRKDPKAKPSNPNYKVITFLICLLIAFMLWLMNTLSKKYTENLTFAIEYSHFPQPQSGYSYNDTLKLKVNTSGFRVLAYKVGFVDKIIKIDAAAFRRREAGWQYNLNNHVHESKIEEQLGEDVKLLDITPDTLFIRPVN